MPKNESTDAKESEDMRLGSDRRNKTVWDTVSGAGGIGSGVIGLFILNLVGSQTATLDRHGDMIQDNRDASKAVLSELDTIKKDFSLDIEQFKLKHLALTQQLNECERQQVNMMGKLDDLDDIERALSQWRDLEIRLQSWVATRFQRKAPEQ
jgi:hypothetical protein